MKTLTLICLTFCSVAIFAQDTTFTKRYYADDSNYENIRSRGLTSNLESGVVICGELTYNDGLVMNIDSLGNHIWNRSLSDPNFYIKIMNGLTTLDSSLLLSGYTYGNDDMESFFCIKMNFQGDTLWSRTFEMNMDIGGESEFVGVGQLSDSSYVLMTSNPSDSLIKVIKLNANGDNEWEKSIKGRSFEVSSIYSDMEDTTFLIAGFVNDLHGGIIKMTNEGEIIWSRLYTDKRIYDVTMLGSEIYALNNSNIWLMKLSENGNFLWLKEKEGIYDPFIEPRSGYPTLTKFNDTLLAVNTNEYLSSRVLTVDTSGSTVNQLHIDGPVSHVEINKNKRVFVSVNGPTYGIKDLLGRDHVVLITTNTDLEPSFCSSSISQTFTGNTDTVFIDSMNLTVSNSSHGINTDYFLDSLILTDDNSCISFFGNLDTQEKIDVKVYPNITNGLTYFDFSKTDTYKIILYSLEGNGLQEVEVNGNSALVDLSSYSSGLYIYKVFGNGATLSGKIVKR